MAVILETRNLNVGWRPYETKQNKISSTMKRVEKELTPSNENTSLMELGKQFTVGRKGRASGCLAFLMLKEFSSPLQFAPKAIHKHST